MYNKFEIIGGAVSIAAMALAIFLLQGRTGGITDALTTQERQPGAVVVSEGESTEQARAAAYSEAADSRGNITELVIDDVKIGSGTAVTDGDTVTVHYIGRLQNGQEFDNSRSRGEPFTFTVGEGRVIPGWEQGIVGMQPGGERILVVPPRLAYGSDGVGPIPGDATLVFAIELLSIAE